MRNTHAAAAAALAFSSLGAQTANWVGPDTGGTWHTPANWSTGLVPGGANQAVIDGETATARAVSLAANASVDKLTISAGDSLQVTGDTSLQTAAAGYTIDGLLELAGGADTRVVVPADDTILDGTGELRLQPGSRILGSGSLRVRGKLAGAGSVGQNATRVVNEVGGRMVANLSGQGLFFQPPYTPAAGLFNQGRMEASGGGLLQLGGSGSASGWFDNTGGVITALDGSAVEFYYHARVEGGTLTSEGTGRLRLKSDYTTTWTGLTHTGQTIVENNATLLAAGTIGNTGTVTLQSTAGFNTRFTLQADTVLTGAGRLVLQGTGTNAAVRGGFALTNTGGHVIEGDGYLGLNDLHLTNAPGGIIESNVPPGHGMAIAPGNHSGIGVVNRGTIRARNGGVVSLSGFGGGMYDNTDGTITAMEGSALYFQSNAVVTGGTLTTEGSGRLRIPPAHATTWTALTHSGQTIVDNGATLRGTGTIENTGTITVQAAAGFNTRFTLQADTVLTGAGRIVLSGEGTAAAVNGSFVLTNTGGQVIEGDGYVGLNDIYLNNAPDGVIESNAPGGGTAIAPGNPAGGIGAINRGTIRARNGGVVSLSGFSGGKYHNVGGTIEALEGSALYFHSNAVVTGGTLTTEGSGRLRVLASHSTTWTALTHSGQTIVENNATLRGTGTIENTGTITVQSTAAPTRFTLQADTVLTGAGRMVLSGEGTAAAVNGSFALTNTGGHVIEGNGYVGLNDLVLTNAADGLIECNVAGQGVSIAPRLPASGPGVTNRGVIRARNGGAVGLSGFTGGQYDNVGGIIEALDGSQVVFVTGPVLSGGVLRTEGTGAMVVPASHSMRMNSDVTNLGLFRVEGNGVLRVNGLITNSGTIRLTGTALVSHLTLVAATTLNGTGTIEMSGDARITGAAVLTVPDQTIRGSGNIGLNETGLSFGQNAVVQADVPGATLRIDPNSVSGLVNQGTMRAQNGALLLAAATGGGDYSVGATGRVEAIEGGSVTFESAASLLNLSGGTLTGGTWLAQGSTAATPLTLPGGAITTNAATIILDGSQAQFAQLAGLTTNSGSLTLRNGASISAGGALTNSGTVEVGAGSSLNVGGTITLAASSSLIHHIAAAPGSPGAVGQVNAPSNTMNLTGMLTVKFDAGFPPQAGQSWKLMDGTPAGTFGTVVVQGLPAGLVAVVTYTDGVRITLNPDGLTYDVWAAGYDFASPADALPTADPDHDGLDNLREYAFGGNPLSADVSVEVEMMVVTVAAQRHLGMRYWHPVGALRRLDLTYSPERSTDILDWPDDGFVVHEVVPPDASGRERVTVRLIEPLFATVRRFIGLRISF